MGRIKNNLCLRLCAFGLLTLIVLAGCKFTELDSDVNNIVDPEIYEWKSPVKITAPDGASNVLFGCSVAISGNYMIVGDEEYNNLGSNQGAAYIYEWNGSIWVIDKKLYGAADWYYFGCSVGITETGYAIIGALGVNSGEGAAYIYKKGTNDWTVKSTIAPGGTDQLGISVAISNTYAAISEPYDDTSGSNAGCVYIYENNSDTWNYQQRILPDGSTTGRFGEAVDISGNFIVVGAPFHNGNEGKIYIFEYSSSWNKNTVPVFDDLVSGNFLGDSVSIYNNIVLSGAPFVNEFTGISYYNGSSWSNSELSVSGDNFGSSVGVFGEYAVIGAKGTNSDTGTAYVFKIYSGNSLKQETYFANPTDLSSGDLYGCSADIASEFLVIGAEGQDSGGAVYIYKKERL